MNLKNRYSKSDYREELIRHLNDKSSRNHNTLMDCWYRLPKVVTVASRKGEICNINDDLGFYFQNFSTFLSDLPEKTRVNFQGARLDLECARQVRMSGAASAQLLAIEECLDLYDQVVGDFKDHISMLDELVTCSDYPSFEMGTDILEHLKDTFFRDYRSDIINVYQGSVVRGT